MTRVTTILTDLFPWNPQWGTDAERQFWLDRGTAVHAACEYSDRGTLDGATVDVEHVLPRLEAWQRFRREIGGEVIAIEHPVEMHRLDYCGRLDRIIRYSSICPMADLLLDIKSGKPAPVCALQTMAYALAAPHKKRPLVRCAVELRADGKYDMTLYRDDAGDTVGWMACLNVYAWKKRNGLVKP
jgi:hypothetical protein